jgi:TPR repeat protein
LLIKEILAVNPMMVFFLEHGQCIEKDLKLASYYFKLSADQGNADGQCNYGCCLEHGRCIEKDLKLAAYYFKLSADQGNAGGQSNYVFFFSSMADAFISFESNSRLIRIESDAFSESSLQSIVIPMSVEILGSSCFSFCRSLSSISFESNSRLIRIESRAFSDSSLQSIMIPMNVEILGSSSFLSC